MTWGGPACLVPGPLLPEAPWASGGLSSALRVVSAKAMGGQHLRLRFSLARRVFSRQLQTLDGKKDFHYFSKAFFTPIARLGMRLFHLFKGQGLSAVSLCVTLHSPSAFIYSRLG